MQTFSTPSATCVSARPRQELVMGQAGQGADQHAQDLNAGEPDRPGRVVEALVGAVESEAVEAKHRRSRCLPAF
jgi:hypothetical protein